MGQWSEKLASLTRRELEDMLISTDTSGRLHWLIGSADLPDGANFKNADGERYGIMSAENARAGSYVIDLEGGGKVQFSSVDDLISAGWALD